MKSLICSVKWQNTETCLHFTFAHLTWEAKQILSYVFAQAIFNTQTLRYFLGSFPSSSLAGTFFILFSVKSPCEYFVNTHGSHAELGELVLSNTTSTFPSADSLCPRCVLSQSLKHTKVLKVCAELQNSTIPSCQLHVLFPVMFFPILMTPL